MKTGRILAAAAGLIAVAAVAAVTSLAQGTGPQPAEGLSFLGEPVTQEQLDVGQKVYAANCASCHGTDLEGQPDWKRRLDTGRMPAPPHDESGHTWHHADRALLTITKLGVGAIVPDYESDMPAFKDVLSDAEITAALAYIKSTWPERERGFQAEVTAGDEGAS